MEPSAAPFRLKQQPKWDEGREGERETAAQQLPKSAKFANDSSVVPPPLEAKGSSCSSVGGGGGAGAARVGPAALPPADEAEEARCLGGAGRGGGCFPFFGGSAGVGLSARATGAKGSVPNGSATAAAPSPLPGFAGPKAAAPVPNGSKGSFVSLAMGTSGAS